MYSQESAWSAKLISITDAGCPSAADRLIRRPSPSRLMRRPSFSEYSSTKVRVVRLEDESFSSAGISISTLKWPEFEMMAPSFISSKCCLASTFLLRSEGARGALGGRKLFERRDIDLDVEVARVRDDGAVLHKFEVLLGEHVLVAIGRCAWCAWRTKAFRAPGYRSRR